MELDKSRDMINHIPSLLFASSVLLAALPSMSTPIIVAGSNTRSTANANDGDGLASQSQTLNPAGYGSNSVTSVAGTASVTNGYDYSVAGNVVTLAHTFEQHLGAPSPYYYQPGFYQVEEMAQTFGSVIFTLEAGDIGYTYALDGRTVQEGTSILTLQSSLIDLTTNTTVLSDFRQIFPATDVTLQTGVSHTPNAGNLSGALVAGHTYRLNYQSYVRHNEMGHGAFGNQYGYTATDAAGHITLTLTGPAPVGAVPEPSTLALMGLGLGACALLARRRKG
jgi:hypothetical protein